MSAGWRRLAAVAAVVSLVAGGWGAWHVWGRTGPRGERLLDEARAFHAAGDAARAERRAAKALELAPSLAEAAFLAAECAAGRREFGQALGYVRRIESADRRVLFRAALLSARLNHNGLHRLSDAERAYREALEFAPDDGPANEGLARLLGLCARRREAIPHVLRLLRGGEATDLLILLAREGAVLGDRDALEQARRSAPDDPNPLLGLAWHDADSGRIEQAIELLREALRRRPGFAAAHAALGGRLLDGRRLDEFAAWSAQAPPEAEEFPETWLVRARAAEAAGDADGAIRGYWEAARRAPESKAPHVRLAALLSGAGERDLARRFAEQARRIQELETVQDGFTESPGYLRDLARRYESVGRVWEAYGWCLAAAGLAPDDPETRRALRDLRTQLEGAPLALTMDAANVAASVDLTRFPVPSSSYGVAAQPAGAVGSAAVSFRNDAAVSGLRFRYVNGAEGRPPKRMFEFTGGGVGVLDYDLDGFADAYMTQGGMTQGGMTQGGAGPAGPPAGGHVDRLFRNVGGTSFHDVSADAGIREFGFGQGAAVGDIDADGFPDVYVANIGGNQLWGNNGDGTFGDVTGAAGIAGDEWTTSCLVADLDGDGLPDIYDVNYVTGDDVFERVCRHPDGAPTICMPFHFEGQPDRLWLNRGDGRFVDATGEVLPEQRDGKGLGVAAWDADGSGRLSVYVANDTTPSFFLAPDSAGGGFRLRDRGLETGLAFNGAGKATGCMGVALGDVDGDGRLDLHVTNFLAEPNTLFLNVADGVYADRTREVGLREPSLGVLGFGTQFLDADLDGRPELFVANGHIDDLRVYGRPYRMPAQLFRWEGEQFAQLGPEGLGPYFRGEWLGRAAARLDWNRDGREDLIVGHLEDDAALLTNTTPRAGRFLSVRLFGVRSNRDAVGTTVEARVGGRTLVRQQTAGDGYQASNERRLVVGVGEAKRIDELVVRWPSGEVQRFEDVAVPRELLLREGAAPLASPDAGG